MNTVELVWDGGDSVVVPKAMGSPASDQMQGTPLEQLSEVSCRVCYDSMGSGRSTTDLISHVLSVGHLSIFEHPTITIELKEEYDKFWQIFTNRPGFWLELKNNDLQITYNIRSIIEWDKYTTATNIDKLTNHTRHILYEYINARAPQSVKTMSINHCPLSSIRHRLVPINEHSLHQAWISLYLSCSRACSHEIVRHGNWTAISQRSTRYVDESKSKLIQHPLITQYLANQPINEIECQNILAVHKALLQVDLASKNAYTILVKELTKFITSRSVSRPCSKLTARKQARGAARNMLPNALQTELIFSASASQWRWMLTQRCSEHADAEIRALFEQVLKALQSSTYAHYFSDYSLVPSPDGIGKVLCTH